MKLRKLLFIAAISLLTASLFSGCMMMTPVRTVQSVTYDNPQWAPPYYSGARYYYLPDLELYYDLASREYIFLSDGRWNFSPYVPSMYRNYDLDNCFCVVLNVEVYKPWLHHQYYISHYPRYYYRDYYDHSGIPYVRAYNENQRRAIYWNANERQRARSWDDENVRDNRRFKYSKDDRKEQQNQVHQGSSTFGGEPRNQRDDQAVRPSNRTETTTQPKPATRQTTTVEPARRATTSQEAEPVRNNRTNYYGKTIGNSVRVTNQMREKTPSPSASRTTRKPDSSK